MKAATAVGPATTVGAATTVECARAVTAGAATAVDCARTVAAEAATAIAAPRTAPIGVPWAISISPTTTVGISRPIAISPTTVAISPAAVCPPGPAIVTASVPAVIPGPRADKHAAHKIVRPIVAVGRTIIRVISVVSISANGRSANPGIHRANSNTHPDLRLCVARAHQQDAQ